MNKIIFARYPLRLALLAISAVFCGLTPARATERYWTGAASANWSDPNNWTPAGTPQNGDDLYFGYVNDANRSMNNDLGQWVGGDLSFKDNDYQLSGNPLTFTIIGGIHNIMGGSHVVTINCPLVFTNFYARIDTGFSSGAITENTIDLHLNGPIRVDGGNLELLALSVHNDIGLGGGNGHLYVSGVVSGTGDVSAYASEQDGHVSVVEFNGTPGNTFTGSLLLFTYNNGEISFNKSSGTVVNGRVLVVPHYDLLDNNGPVHLNLTRPSQIGGMATIEVDAGMQLSLSGNNCFVGSLVFNNYSADAAPCVLDTGTTLVGLNVGISSWNENASVVPVVRGHLNLNGALAFDIRGPAYAGLDIQATMANTGGFTKTGNATLLLEANNTFGGPVVISQGILDVRNNGALGSTAGGTTLSGSGSLTLRNVSIAAETLFSEGNQPVTPETVGSLLFTVGTCSWAGPIRLDHNLVVFADNTTLSGPISGVGGLDVRNGTALLGGTLGNPYTGTTLVRCALLEFGKPSGVNAYAGPLVVGGGGGGPYEARWLQSYQNVGATATLYANGIININNFTEDFGPVTFNGGEVDTGSGTFNIYAPVTVNAAPTSAVINGYLGLPPGDNRVFIVGDGASDCDLLVSAVVFGSPGLYVVKQGAGTMCLANFNTFNAPTLLEQGILDINNSQSLGTWPGLVIFDGATLRVSGAGTGGGFEAIGAGVGGIHGAVEILPNASFTFAGGMLLDGPTTFNVGQSGGLALNASISSSGPNCSVLKTGTGTMSFGGTTANTYSGDTIINAGQCWLGKSANVISVPGNLVIGPGPSGPTTAAHLLQVGGLGGSMVTVNANSLFDLNGYSMSLPQLNLRDGGNVQTTGGTLSFPNGGSVNVGSQSLFGSHVASTISGLVGLPIGGTVTFNVSPAAPTPPLLLGPELEVPATISGGMNHGTTGTLAKEGLGQLRLSGNSTFLGNVNINAGTVIAASANALGSTFRGTAVNYGAQLIIEGGINIAGEYIGLDSTNSLALESRNGPNTLGGVLYLNRNSRVGPMSLSETLLANGQIDGPGSLTKVGLGTLSLGGPTGNTFAGETFVNQGTLLLNKPIAVTAIPTALEIGAVDDSTAGTARNLNSYQIVGNIYIHSRGLYDVNGQEENTDALVMYGNAVVQTGAGYVSLKTGAPIVVSPGSNTTSTINGTVMLDPGSHTLTIGSGATAPGVQDLVVNAVIGESSNGGGLQKEGAGRMRLTANNSYTGSTVINAGTLQIDGSQGQSSVTVNSGTLQGSGTVGAVSLTSASATVSPGASPGILNSGSFGGGSGTVRIELNGTTPGTGYDQLNVSGSVNLAGMSLSASLGYASSTNDQFTIINNDLTDPVTGTFSGLPQGKKLYIGQQLFQLSYNGGSGNDVVLSRLITPPPPALTIQRASPTSVRLLWQTNDPPFSLQTASSLPSTNWATALPLPVVIGTNNVVTNLISNFKQFYRLSSP